MCWICLNKPEYALIMFQYLCEYALIMLHMIEYACIYLKKQFWVCKNSDAWFVAMTLKYFVKNTGEKPQCPSVCLNMPEYWWISLNMPENAWINCSDFPRVFNMPQYNYNIIIIVTNVFILQFLSSQFVYPDSLLPFYFF